MYALAASAAGVSALALASPAEGKIVYTSARSAIIPGSKLGIDLTNNGTSNFMLSDVHAHSSGFATLNIQAGSVTGSILGGASSASQLRTGSRIGGSRQFHAGQKRMAFSFVSNRCDSSSCITSVKWQWNDATRGYLGFKFTIKGKTHYGWARMDVTDGGGEGIYGLLTGYAYETVPDKAIIAGKTKGPDVEEYVPSGSRSTRQPGTLGRLAQGAGGLSQADEVRTGISSVNGERP
jgi:hypothetical protein